MHAASKHARAQAALDWFGRYGSFVFLTVVLATLISTWFISYAHGDDWGGLRVPYVSDTAKTPPNYIVFAVGMTVSATLYALLALLAARAQGAVAVTGEDRRLAVLRWPALAFAWLAALGMALLAILDTQTYPTAHLAFALLFFVCAVVWVGFDLGLTRRWIRLVDPEQISVPLRRTWRAKCVVAAGLYVSFLVYLPVGLTVVSMTCPWVINPATGYYDYTNCYALNELRVATQYLSILFVLVYIAMVRPALIAPPAKTGSSSP